MDLALTEEQRLLDAALRRLLAERVTNDARRAAAEAGGADPALWEALRGLGLPGLLVPEEHGGAGLGLVDAALAAEALGHAAAPAAPFLGTAVLAPLALRVPGTPQQQGAWPPRLAEGELRVAVSLAALSGVTGACDLRLRGGRLSGAVAGALDAPAATHLLVALPGAGAGMALVAADAPGVALRPRAAVDRLRPLADLAFDGAPAEALAPGDAHRVLEAGRIALAADTLGAARAMLEQAVAYAGQRRQFGRPIAAFQAVKHACAEMAAALEPCRALVRAAAAAWDAEDAEAPMLAASAKAHLDEAARDVARHATEVHGGMGFTELLGLPFWFRRILANRQLLGGPERCREDAAAAWGVAAG